MKKNIIKLFIGIMCLCLVIYILGTNSSKHIKSIDLKGADTYWITSLNLQQDISDLIIKPATDNFKIPSEISIDIIVNNKCLYTDKLKYIPHENYLLGKYMVRFKSNNYYRKNFNNIKLVIRFNDKSSSILLKPRTI